jgi:hypothetical protein
MVALGGFARPFFIHHSSFFLRPSVALGGFAQSLSIPDCSPAEKIPQAGDKPRNTPNTRKANREEGCFPLIPRILRIPRSIPLALDCGFATQCLCAG